MPVWRARLPVAWVTDPWLAQAAVVHVLDPHGEQARTGLREFVAADGSINLTAPMLIADIMSNPALADGG